MSNVDYQTFITGGLIVLVIAVIFVAWAIYRVVERQRDMEALALEGVGLELKANLTRLARQLSDVAHARIGRASNIVAFSQPQLDSLVSGQAETDRETLTALRGLYDELHARQGDVRDAVRAGGDTDEEVALATQALVSGLAWLYLWEEHGRVTPVKARSTRSWYVRDWMKAGIFDADMIPGIHLRDAVVERLRTMGMVLTPKPLTYTAHEYFSKQYDRQADPHAPFWNRDLKWPSFSRRGAEAGAAVAAGAALSEAETAPLPAPAAEAPAEPATPEPEAQPEPVAEAASPPQPEPAPIAASEPAPDPVMEEAPAPETPQPQPQPAMSPALSSAPSVPEQAPVETPLAAPQPKP
ncbi:MAG: hypothetical protein AAF613_10225, partial [Pseudomonadota bacterium]